MRHAHTPGPWMVEKGWQGQGYTITAPLSKTSVNGERGLVADTEHSPFLEQSQANARLIASAPDLLAALQDIVACAYFTGPHGGKAYAISDARMAAVKQAICKATGAERLDRDAKDIQRENDERDDTDPDFYDKLGSQH